MLRKYKPSIIIQCHYCKTNIKRNQYRIDKYRLQFCNNECHYAYLKMKGINTKIESKLNKIDDGLKDINIKRTQRIEIINIIQNVLKAKGEL